MTIGEAIKGYDGLFPNSLPYSTKLKMISRLDKRIHGNLYSKYENCEPEVFNGYFSDTSPDTQLLLPYPYEIMYIEYLAACCDLLNCDIQRYNNSARVFDTDFDDYCKMYHRTHRWKKTVKVGFGG